MKESIILWKVKSKSEFNTIELPEPSASQSIAVSPFVNMSAEPKVIFINVDPEWYKLMQNILFLKYIEEAGYKV